MRIILASTHFYKIMFKKILLTLAILSAQSIANNDTIIKNLAPFFGKINADNIVKTPFKGVYEVVTLNPISSVLISEDGRYLIEGDVVDLKIRAKMPASQKVKKLKQNLLNGIDDKDKIIFKAKNEQYIIHVFTDVDCPFCQKLHAQMGRMNELGITVKYLASPLATLHPKAQGKMEKIWCAADKVKAMDAYKKHRTVPNSKACDNPVSQQLTIAEQLGVNGTPAIFLADGSHIPGYMPADRLLKRIEAAK